MEVNFKWDKMQIFSWPQAGGGPQHAGTSSLSIGSGTPRLLVKAQAYGNVALGLIFSQCTNLLYYSSNFQRCYAVASNTNGSAVWVQDLGRNLWGKNYDLYPPALSPDEKTIYFTCLGTLFAFDSRTGAQLWNNSSPDGMPVVGASGTVYVSGSRYWPRSPLQPKVSNLAAFNGNTGQLNWASIISDLDRLSPCVLDNNEQVCVLGQLRGVSVYGISTKDGSVLWQNQYMLHSPESPFVTSAPVKSYGMVIDRVAYLPISQWRLVSVDVYTGEKLFNGSAPKIHGGYLRYYSDATAALSLVNGVNGSYVVVGIQTPQEQYIPEICFAELKNLTHMECQVTGGALTSQPYVTADGFVLVTSCYGGFGSILAYDTNNGFKQVWHTDVRELCSQSFIAVDMQGIIYAVDTFGRFFSFQIVNGKAITVKK